MPKASHRLLSAEDIAKKADRGEDVSAHFTNQFMVVKPPAQRVNVDFTAPMLIELDHEAKALNISRQAVIKAMLRDSLDRRYLAQQARRAG